MKIKIYMILIFCMIIFITSPIFVEAEETINTKVQQLLNNVSSLEQENTFLENHPVGSIYMTTNESENTTEKISELYGGEWEVYSEGKSLVGYSSTNSKYNDIELTGGSETTTLTIENLPAHTHTISHTHTTPKTTIASSGAHTHSTTAKTITSGFSLTANSAGSHTHAFSYGGKILVLGSTTSGATDGFTTSNGAGTWWPNINKTLSQVETHTWSHNHNVTGSITIPALSISSGAHTHTIEKMTTDSQSTTNSGSVGSGESFSNLDPYITVYMFKRVG